jgi:hypothetical protein
MPATTRSDRAIVTIGSLDIPPAWFRQLPQQQPGIIRSQWAARVAGADRARTRRRPGPRLRTSSPAYRALGGRDSDSPPSP